MNFELTEYQQMIKALAERFVTEHYSPGARALHRASDRGYSASNWRQMAELGILALPFAGDHGGMDGGPVEIMVMMEVLGRGLVVEPVLAETILAGGILAAAGTDAQQTQWIAPMVAGERHPSFAFAEHDARWNLAAAETRFADHAISGTKTFVSATDDSYIVSADNGAEIGLYLVEAEPRVSTQPYRLIDGSHAVELRFDAARAEPLAGTLATIAPVLDRARLAACAEMIGVIAFLFDTTLDYVRQRRQFGAPIGSFQAIQHRLADLYALSEQARSQLLRATLATADEQPAAIAAAKAYISRAAVQIAEQSVQLHGGMGISEELDIGAALKRVLLLSTFLGDADYETRRYNAAALAR